MPCGVIDAAVISVDDCNGAPAREKRDSQKQRYGDCSGTDMACDFRFHRYSLLPFPSENFPTVAKIFEIRISVADHVGSRHNRKEKETIEQHRAGRAIAHAAAP